MNLVKKIAVAGATVTLALGTYAVPVFAAAEGTNEGITNDSFADAKAYDDDEVKVKVKNEDTDFFNFDSALATSGLNEQSYNDDGNNLTTESGGAWFKTDNFLNVNETTGHGGALAANEDISNSSDGDAKASDNDHVRVKNENKHTTVWNLTLSIANTGANTQDYNEDGNSLIAGGAESLAVTSNVVNHNKLIVGADDSSAIAMNSNITNDSFADSYASDDDYVKVYNKNEYTVVGNVTTSIANSGGNSQSDNDDGNDMTTGQTSSVAVASNYVNVNETKVGGGGAQASNNNITQDSFGDSKASDNDYIKVKNENKDTTVTNVTVSVSNSGDNTQSGNEDGNTMTTGDASATGQTTNVVNANQVNW
ncbi:hypothetical protein HYT02_04775 [Candidatus Gottesmanbacteria bacterium]|nr:hypothetical protein [Candidatus Gottesmanbacteria bacterium]